MATVGTGLPDPVSGDVTDGRDDVRTSPAVAVGPESVAPRDQCTRIRVGANFTMSLFSIFEITLNNVK